ncbi:HipA domain-containing protein [Sulfurimonas sp.]
MRCYGCLKEIRGKSQYCSKCKKNIFNNIDVKPLTFNKEEFYTFKSENTQRMSISGVQDKISLKFSDANILEPTEVQGHYILKPVPNTNSAQKIEDIPMNEHVSMQISKQIFKLDTAENGLIEFSDGELAYITKRFDYQKNRAHTVAKVEQEDFASILNYTSEINGRSYKYEGSYEAIAKGIKKYVAAYAPALEEFYKRLLLNYLIGNGDAHLKNFSLMRPLDRDDYILTPNYDLLYTGYHIENDSLTAIDLFDEYETEAFGAQGQYTLQDFEEFGLMIGIPEKRLIKIFKEILQNEPKVYEMVSNSYLSDAAKEAYVSNYEKKLHKYLLYFIDSFAFKDRSVLVKVLL